MKNKETSKNGNKNAARDFKPPEKISPELKELMEATREAMEALRSEEEKYGKKPGF